MSLHGQKSTLHHLTPVDSGDVLVLDLLHSLHQLSVSVEPSIVLDEVFLEVHDVLVGRFLGAVDVNGSEVGVGCVLHEGQQVKVGTLVRGLSLPHALFELITTL